MTEQTEEKVLSEEVQEEQTAPADVVEVEWEQMEELIAIKQELARTENAMAAFLLDVEKKRASGLDRISALEEAALTTARSIQKAKGLDEEIVYELRLPSAEGEKGYFIRKDS